MYAVDLEQVEPAEQVQAETAGQAERQEDFEEIRNPPLYRVMLYYKYHTISILLL
jgi:hypothetical protein